MPYRDFLKCTLLASIFLFPNNTIAQIKTVDVFIKNTTVVDVVNKEILYHKTLILDKGHIVAIANSSSGYTAKKSIDGSKFVAIPGFVNTHTHLWQHICKSCSPNESLQKWIKIYKAIHCLNEKELRTVVFAASSEAALSGITTVSDYASLSFNDFGFDVNADAIKEAGLGGVIVWNNPSIFLPDNIKLRKIPELQEKYKGTFNIWMGQGPLSFYSLPQVYSGIRLAQLLHMDVTEHTMENNQEQKDLFDILKNYYEKYKTQLSLEDRTFFGNILTTRRPSDVDAYEKLLHEAKSVLDIDNDLKSDTLYIPLKEEEKQLLKSLAARRSISPLAILEYFNILKGFLSIHSVWQEDEDIEIMKRNGITISHNPESNLYLSSGIAPVKDYLNNHILVSLGTDGAASNDGINMFSAMKEMWNLYKISALNNEVSRNIDAWDVLQAATINGAKALKIDGFTGSLDAGKEADLSLISMDELGMSPIRPDKLLTLLIYSANTKNVKYVFSNGKMLVREGHLQFVDEHKLAADLTKIANLVDSRIREGKIWSETYQLADSNIQSVWYRYRSVRVLDSFNVKVVNKSKIQIRLSVISSGQTFSGGSPFVVDEQVKARFPENPDPKAFQEEVLIMPGESCTISKRRKVNEFIISIKGNTIIKQTVSGQLLLMCQSTNSH